MCVGIKQAVGVSNFNLKEMVQMSEILEKHGVKLASNQIEFNLLRQSPLKNGLLDEMRKRGIVCLACESPSPTLTCYPPFFIC